MKKTSEFSESFSKGATEAREKLHQTADKIEAEWHKVVEAVEESDKMPGSVKTAIDRLDGAVDDVKGFVVSVGPQVVAGGARVARQVGIPIPEEWGADTDTETAGDSDDVSGDVDDGPEGATASGAAAGTTGAAESTEAADIPSGPEAKDSDTDS